MEAPLPASRSRGTQDQSKPASASPVLREEDHPPASPSPSLSSSIGALGLSVDSVTLSGPITYGFPVYDAQHKGRVIFSLRELEEGELWYTENHNSVRRISPTHVLLGETIEVAIPEEEAFDASRGILTFNGEQLLLLEDSNLSAEAEVERCTGMKFYEGIPMSSIEPEGTQERGIVVFTLQQLPDGQPFYFKRKNCLTIERTGDNTYTINGKEFQGADVRQVLPADSSLLDLVFPHDRPGADSLHSYTDDDDDYDNDKSKSEAEESEGAEGHEDILKQILAASEAPQAEEEEEIARAMLREFDERLKNATIRRAQEKRRRLSLMMKQYSSDPSSPFRAFFLPASPLSTSGTSIPVRPGKPLTDEADAVDATESSGKDAGPTEELLTSTTSTSSTRLPDITTAEKEEEGGLEDVDLCTPRRERRRNSTDEEQDAQTNSSREEEDHKVGESTDAQHQVEVGRTSPPLEPDAEGTRCERAEAEGEEEKHQASA